MERIGMGKSVRGGTLALLAVTAALVAVVPAEAQEVVETEQVHVVRQGDTLWDIARRYLSDPYRWPEIFQLNRDVVANPHWIFPAERLRIPSHAWSPRLPTMADTLPMGVGEAGRTVFFVPDAATEAEHRLRLTDEVPVPVVTTGDFLRAGLLVPEGTVRPVGRLAELLSPSIVPARMPPQIGQYDRVYMTILSAGGVRVGDELHLLRESRQVRPHGMLYEITGIGTVAAIDGNVATIVVEQLYDVVAVGDWAVPMPSFRVPYGISPRPSGGLEGTIVTFQTPHALQSVEDVAFVDLGSASGVTEGDEFVVLLPEERRSWGIRPEIEVARLRVVRATERTAAARVIGLDQPALEPGLRIRLVAKMP